MTPPRTSGSVPPGCYDRRLEWWLAAWERAYDGNHPLVAFYFGARGFLRALRLDLHLGRPEV